MLIFQINKNGTWRDVQKCGKTILICQIKIEIIIPIIEIEREVSITILLLKFLCCNSQKELAEFILKENLHKFYNMLEFSYAPEKQDVLERLILGGNSFRSATAN